MVSSLHLHVCVVVVGPGEEYCLAIEFIEWLLSLEPMILNGKGAQNCMKGSSESKHGYYFLIGRGQEECC